MEKINYKDFRENYSFERKGKGLKAVPKSKSAQASDKKHKYHAEPTTRDNIKFPSKKEAKTYDKLKLWERAGAITNLKVNAALKGEEKIKYVFQLEPFQFWYEPDFEYDDVQTGQHIVADSKGVKTDVYLKKKRLMKKMFDIEITEF